MWEMEFGKQGLDFAISCVFWVGKRIDGDNHGLPQSSKTCQLKDCERVHNHFESRLFKNFKRMEMVVTWKETSVKDGTKQKSIVWTWNYCFLWHFFVFWSYYMHVGALRIANETLSLSRQPPLVVTPEMLGIRFGVPFPSVTVCILHIEIVSCAKDLNPTNALHLWQLFSENVLRNFGFKSLSMVWKWSRTGYQLCLWCSLGH